MTSTPTTTPPRDRGRLPTAAEMRKIADRAFLKATREFNEENREIIEARSRHPPTPAEIDEIFAERMAEALEEVRAKAPPAPTPEEVASDPACVWRWIDEAAITTARRRYGKERGGSKSTTTKSWSAHSKNEPGTWRRERARQATPDTQQHICCCRRHHPQPQKFRRPIKTKRRRWLRAAR